MAGMKQQTLGKSKWKSGKTTKEKFLESMII